MERKKIPVELGEFWHRILYPTQPILPKFQEKLDELYNAINLMPDKARTECAIIQMFCENTGKEFLDSGDFYGRKYEAAQQITDWNALPPLTWRKEYFEKNTYHYLKEMLVYNPDLDREFFEFTESDGHVHEDYTKLMKMFLESKGLTPYIQNTYNTDSVIDSVLLFAASENIDLSDPTPYCGAIILLRTHNGCDVRSGYSTPHLFLTVDGEDFIDGINNLILMCPFCQLELITHDGYRFDTDVTSFVCTELVNQTADHQKNYETVFCPRCGARFDVANNGDDTLTFPDLVQLISKYWARVPYSIVDFFRDLEVDFTPDQWDTLKNLRRLNNA